MNAEQITTVIVAIVGSGVLSAIVTAISLRRKVGAEADATAHDSLARTADTLMQVAEKRIKSLCERVEKLELQVTALQESAQLRENVIDKLEDENRTLKEQLGNQEKELVSIRRENEGLRKRIKELETQVFQLRQS